MRPCCRVQMVKLCKLQEKYYSSMCDGIDLSYHRLLETTTGAVCPDSPESPGVVSPCSPVPVLFGTGYRALTVRMEESARRRQHDRVTRRHRSTGCGAAVRARHTAPALPSEPVLDRVTAPDTGMSSTRGQETGPETMFHVKHPPLPDLRCYSASSVSGPASPSPGSGRAKPAPTDRHSSRRSSWRSEVYWMIIAPRSGVF